MPDLSKSGSVLNVPLGSLVLTAQFGSTASIRLSIRAKDTATPVLADIRRTSIYDAAAIESQTLNNTRISTSQVLDDVVYSQSQETHWMRIRPTGPGHKPVVHVPGHHLRLQRRGQNLHLCGLVIYRRNIQRALLIINAYLQIPRFQTRGIRFRLARPAAREIPLPARFKHDMMDRANGMNQAGRRL